MEKLEHILHSQKALDEFENCDNQTLRNISLNISHYLFMLAEFYQDRLSRLVQLERLIKFMMIIVMIRRRRHSFCFNNCGNIVLAPLIDPCLSSEFVLLRLIMS